MELQIRLQIQIGLTVNVNDLLRMLTGKSYCVQTGLAFLNNILSIKLCSSCWEESLKLCVLDPKWYGWLVYTCKDNNIGWMVLQKRSGPIESPCWAPPWDKTVGPKNRNNGWLYADHMYDYIIHTYIYIYIYIYIIHILCMIVSIQFRNSVMHWKEHITPV